jgi:hypothetical protein
MSLVARFQLVSLYMAVASGSALAQSEHPWPAAKAHEWAKAHPWLVGCNYAPAYAINQLEMWQADSFDPAAIDRELTWAESLGFTSIRVFLHDLLWEQDSEAFLKRIDQFLEIAAKHKIGVMFVLFDSVWDPFPQLGKQRAPKPGLHNSGWVQSPGVAILKDPSKWSGLKPYVQGVVRRFKDDPRIHAWDLINEPENPNRSSYGRFEPQDKAELALALLKNVFAWVREIDPSQPLTTGVWIGDWSAEKITPINKFQLEQSDIISFHCYDPIDTLKTRIEPLRNFGRPLVCTEFMARPRGSTFDPILAYFKDQNIGGYCWGFVSGKSQTIYPWDSWQSAYEAEPKVWFHDIFRTDGTPFDEAEVAYIRKITGK